MSKVQQILNNSTPEGKVIMQTECKCGNKLPGHLVFEYSCGRKPCPKCKKKTEVKREVPKA